MTGHWVKYNGQTKYMSEDEWFDWENEKHTYALELMYFDDMSPEQAYERADRDCGVTVG